MILPVRRSAILLLAALLTSSSTRADDARAVDVARKSFAAGMDQYRSGDLEGARIALAQSYAAWPSVETLRNLAIAELNTDHLIEALRHLKMYARDTNADRVFVKTKLPGFVNRCQRHLGRLRVVAASDAIVNVDGHRVEEPSEPIDVQPGRHTVAIRVGGLSEERSTEVAASQTVEVSFVGPGLAEPVEQAAVDAPDSPVTPQATAASRRREGAFWTTRNVWVASLATAAVVSAGVGVGFGVAANGNRSAIDGMRAGSDPSLCASSGNATYCQTLRSAIGAQQTNATASNVAFGVAGALAAGTIVLWAVWPHAAPKHAGPWWIAPLVARGFGAVVSGGEF